MTLLRKTLSLAMVKKIALAAEKTAIENNIRIVISIYDNSGNLKYFQRMDDVGYGSIRISKLKAKTCASMPISTKALAERNASLAVSPYSGIPDIVLLGGGLPIMTQDGQHIGGIGISGATQQLDEVCAQAGIEAITAELA